MKSPLSISRSVRVGMTMLSFVVLSAGPAWSISRDYYSSEKTAKAWAKQAHKRWMSGLPNSAKLSAVSLPGTHDTCARYGGDLAQTQAWSVKEQLEAGIRFLDIRCRHIENVFTIHHGIIYQKINFGEVRDICETFLKQNPTEIIVMSIKPEHTAVKNTRSFAATFKSYTSGSHARYWSTGTTVPTVGQVRGKIVLVSRASGIGGLPWSGVDFQDDYKVPTVFAIKGKTKKVLAQLQKARSSKDQGKWFINFSSGTGLGAYPYTVARNVNNSVYQWLGSNPKGRVGTIVIDFPGEKLIARIIATNTLASPKRALNIASLKCLGTTESGEDEIYLKIIVDGKQYRYPSKGSHKMNERSKIETWNVNRTYRYQRTCRVEIWEDDSSSKDDHIGSVTVTATTRTGRNTSKFRKVAKYDITTEVAN